MAPPPTIAISGAGFDAVSQNKHQVRVPADAGTLSVMVDIGGSATQWTVTTDNAAITTSV